VDFQDAVFDYCQMAISMIALAALFGGGIFFVRPTETPDCERQVKLEAADQLMKRTHIRENLRNCYRDLVRWNALYAAEINRLYHIAIGSTTHDCAIHIDDR